MLSVVVYVLNIYDIVIDFVKGLLACMATNLLVVGFKDKFDRVINFLAKYTMSIFLMHTLFAAPLRLTLLKIGINNALIQVEGELSISFFMFFRCCLNYEKTKW